MLVQTQFSIKTVKRLKVFSLFCWLLQFSEAYAKNVTNFSMSNIHLWALITLSQGQIYILSHLKIKSRLPLYWTFISCDKNVAIHTIYVNNMGNPKMKAFHSYFSVHEARHDFFFFWNVKNWLLKYQHGCLRSSINVCAFLWLLQSRQEDEYTWFLGICIIWC